jgi:hypothetical protein
LNTVILGELRLTARRKIGASSINEDEMRVFGIFEALHVGAL